MFDGNNLSPDATADDLGMEEHDEIDAMLSQVSVRSLFWCVAILALIQIRMSQVGG